MACAGSRFIHPIIRSSLFSISSPCSPISHSTTSTLLSGNFGPLKTWIKGLEPVLHNCASDFRCQLFSRRIFSTNFSFAGSGLITGSLIGVSAIYGFVNLSPRFAHAMHGHDLLLDDCHVDSWGAPDLEEKPRAFFEFVRRLWLPVLFFVYVLMNWDHPFTLAVKLGLFLLSTRPAPFSVYLYVEQFFLLLEVWHLVYKYIELQLL